MEQTLTTYLEIIIHWSETTSLAQTNAFLNMLGMV